MKCLWCTDKAVKGRRLCKRHLKAHRRTERARYVDKRAASTRTYTCRECGQEGHNSRRHKDDK